MSANRKPSPTVRWRTRVSQRIGSPHLLTTKWRVPASNFLRQSDTWPHSVFCDPVLWDSDASGASLFHGNCPVFPVLYFLWGSLGGQFVQNPSTVGLAGRLGRPRKLGAGTWESK